MSVTPIGAMIIEIRANSAKFQAEMDKVRGTTSKAGQSATDASRLFAKFASEGLGSVLPIGFRVQHQLEKIIAQMIGGRGALAAMASPAKVLVAIFGSFFAGNIIQNFRELGNTAESYTERLKLAVGITGSFEERLKKAAEEQKKFGSAMETQRDLMRGLAIELAKLRGDEVKALDLTFKGREAALSKQLGGLDTPEAKKALAELAKLRVESERKVLDDISKLRDEADQKLLDSIKKMRETIEEQSIAAATVLGFGPGESLVEGFRDITKLQNALVDFQGTIRDLAKEGRPLRDIFDENAKAQQRFDTTLGKLEERFKDQPLLLEKLNKSVGDLKFGGLQRILDDVARSAQGAKQGFASLIDTTEGIDQTWTPIVKDAGLAVTGLLTGLNSLSPSSDAAYRSLVTMTDQTNRLAEALRAAQTAAVLLNAQIGQAVGTSVLSGGE
jgi:hypothetical protein